MAIVNQPCYCTREQVRKALDVKQASYADEQIDRAICSATDAVEDLTGRRFYIEDTTRKWDWPNFQYSYPWRLWLDKWELAAPPTLVTTGSLQPTPVVIPLTAVICMPVNSGPPFTSIQLRRDTNYAFGYNNTPQLDIAITGTYGYWMKTRGGGSLAASVGLGDQAIAVSDGVSVGVGDVIIIDSERMIVIDAGFDNTTFTYTGLGTASAANNVVTVSDGTQFMAGEVLQVDSEWMLILSITGNNLTVKRAWSSSVLAAHSGGTIYARRLLNVLRGALGTTAATHTSGTSIRISDVPALARELAIAEAEVWLAQEPVAYGGGATPPKSSTSSKSGFNVSESIPGVGLYDIRHRVENSRLTRKARTRVI